MINASKVQKISNAVRSTVPSSPEFLQIMKVIEQKITEAAYKGADFMIIRLCTLPTFANYMLPNNVVKDGIGDVGKWWWTFVCHELINHGFTINKTNTCDQYEIRW